MKINRVKAVCIKNYLDEDSLQDFDDGKIDYEDIKEYKVGEIHKVVDIYYDKNYWKLV